MIIKRSIAWIISLACLAPAGALAAPQAGSAEAEAPVKKDVPFVPTREDAVNRMLDMAGVGPRDVVYDLGSGDGRIVVGAAKRGAQAYGVDIDPQRIQESEHNARSAGVTERAHFKRGNLFDADIRGASVVTLYLLPDVNLKLQPKLLRDLRPGTRVVSHDFHMGAWRPDRTEEVGTATLYLWIVPANVEGRWTLNVPTANGTQPAELVLEQKYQDVTGTMRLGGQSVPISGAKLTGDQLTFTASGLGPDKGAMQFRGTVRGDAFTGQVGSAALRREFTASRTQNGRSSALPAR